MRPPPLFSLIPGMEEKNEEGRRKGGEKFFY